jgi:hypothetical protein
MTFKINLDILVITLSPAFEYNVGKIQQGDAGENN